MKKILVVEDDIKISKLIVDTLKIGNYESQAVFDGTTAISYIESRLYDMVLLDLMLPKKSGFEVLREVKKKDIPVIAISARTDSESIVNVLKNGGNDYITKPFDPLELLARINLRIRKDSPVIYTYKDITIDTDKKIVYNNNKKVDLALKEYELFLLLIKNLNKTLTRTEILSKVWDINIELETRTIDYHIGQLRKKLDLQESIITVKKVGYCLES